MADPHTWYIYIYTPEYMYYVLCLVHPSPDPHRMYFLLQLGLCVALLLFFLVLAAKDELTFWRQLLDVVPTVSLLWFVPF